MGSVVNADRASVYVEIIADSEYHWADLTCCPKSILSEFFGCLFFCQMAFCQHAGRGHWTVFLLQCSRLLRS